MIKLTKFLALLLAMMLCVTAFAACSRITDAFSNVMDAISGNNHDDDEDEDNIDFSGYEDLSPDKIWDEVRDADCVKVLLEDFNGDYDIVIIKNRQKAKIEYNGIINYVDFKKGQRYVENDDGTYKQIELTDNKDWESWLRITIEDVLGEIGVGFFLEDDWFEKSGSIYTATIDTLENFEIEAESVSAYMETQKTTYTFICDITKDGEEKRAACKVQFDEFTVKMPNSSDVIAPSGTTEGTTITPQTTNKPTTTIPSPTPTPDTKPPVVTTAPTTQAPVTTSPDTPVYPQIPEGMMTPSQLLEDLKAATDATVLLKLIENGMTVNYEIEKDGDLYSLKATTPGVNGYLKYEYYDLANKRCYYMGNDGNWYYYQNATATWEGLISEMNDAVHGTLSIGDHRYQYDAALNRLILNSDSCDELKLKSVSLKKSGVQQILSIVYPDFSTSSLNVKFSIFSALKLPSAQPKPN